MVRNVLLAGLACAMLAAPAPSANDSTAEMTTGGLVLRDNRDVDLVDEDLYISTREIRVDYVFRNRAPNDVRVIVAFPMPDLSMEEESWGGDIATVTGFATRVDGRLVTTQVERRAVVGGTDHTDLLTRLGIPLAPDPHEGGPFYAALERLSPADREALRALGLIRVEGDAVTPLWTYREAHYWTQTFPTGRDIRISHRYVPGVGGTVVFPLEHRPFREGEGGREMIRDYCVDRAFLAALDRATARNPERQVFVQQTVGYILRTGANLALADP